MKKDVRSASVGMFYLYTIIIIILLTGGIKML
jgi:hypothetical protein